MKKRGVTILAVGDRKDYDSYRKFYKERRFFIQKGFDYASVDYRGLSERRLPAVGTDKILAFLFFPFYYWDKYIEHRNYRGIYGSLVFYRKFQKVCGELSKTLKNAYNDKDIAFINNPESCAYYRDKLEIKKGLARSGVATPKVHRTSGVKDVERMLNRGHNLFVKPRCGSMGKGITYLSWPEWQTNFAVRGARIISRRSDYGWRFKDVTGDHSFLRQLLRGDMMVEEAVNMLIVDKLKIDLRIYTFFGKVVYMYPRKNDPDKVTTNITQGGKGAPEVLAKLPKALVSKARKIAEKASKVLGFNMAGIDVALDRNLKDAYVLDINAFPGFPRRRTFNISRAMGKELITLINKKKIAFK